MLLLSLNNVFAQSGEGTPGSNSKKKESKPATPVKVAPAPPPVKKVTTPSVKKPNRTAPPASQSSKSNRTVRTVTEKEAPEPAPECEESALVVRCDMPECNIAIDGESQGVTDLKGELRIPVARGKRNIVVSKIGYDTSQSTVNIPCGQTETVNLRPKLRPFDIRIRTSVPGCDIFINDPPESIGKSDENGLFSFPAKSETVLVQVKKPGYLATIASVSHAIAQKEVLFKLKPMPGQVVLDTNTRGAAVRVEGEEKQRDISEPILLEPGRQKLIISALGHVTLTLELDLHSNETLKRTITLEHLPPAELLKQAGRSLEKGAYEETLLLCNLVLESEQNNAAANRLIGTLYLEKHDYNKAEPYLLRAIDGNEAVTLKIRRHYDEKFEVTGGHGPACEGILILNKSEIEYKGFSNAAENFKVPYRQLQVTGLQLKKNVAMSLSMKVADAKGNKKDYNIFGRDQELTQSEAPYLNMISRLIQRFR